MEPTHEEPTVAASTRAGVADEELTGEEQVPNSPRERTLELIVTILLAFSALMSAWSAYQASRYSGEQSFLYSEALGLQVESARLDTRAGQLIEIDVGIFQSWINATAADNQPLADFYRDRFRDEFEPAFAVWLATDPFENPDAPRTPFELAEYRLARQVGAEALSSQAAESFEQGNDKGETSDDYVLNVVLFASALFMLGIQSRIGIFELRAALVAVAGVLIVIATVWVIILPTSWP